MKYFSIIVSGFPLTATDEDLKTLFCKFGNVIEVIRLENLESNNLEETAKIVIESNEYTPHSLILNGYDYMGHKIKVVPFNKARRV